MAAAATVFAACDEQKQGGDDFTEVAPEFTSSIDDIVVTEETLETEVTFSYSAADFGVDTQINYAIEVQIGTGAKAVVATSTTTEAKATLEDINYELVTALGITVGTPTDVNFYVSAQMGASEKLYSQPESVKVMAIEAGDKKSDWGLIGGMVACENWNKDIVLLEGEEYLYVLGVELAEGDEFKFRKGASWDTGIELAYAGTVMPNAEYAAGHGGNIKMGATGTYDIYLLVETEEKENSTGKFYIMTAGKTPDEAGEAEVIYVDPSAETFNVGLSGDILGWDTPTYETNDRAEFKTKTVTDEATYAGTYTFELSSVSFAAGELFKVRINDGWFGYNQVTVEGLNVTPEQAKDGEGKPVFNEDQTPKYDDGANFIVGDAGTYKMTVSFTWDGLNASEIVATFAK